MVEELRCEKVKEVLGQAPDAGEKQAE